ncbi:MAG: hypothetical protein PHY27_03190 [Parabacteroides sp.]|nr:hypothetical protein [Parabacteroides sp.]
MDTATKNQYMLMVLYLMTKFSNQRQGIETKNSEVSIQYPIVLKNIIASINEEYHFDLNSVITDKECLMAESYLSTYLTFIVKNDVPPSIEDERILLKESIEITKEQLVPANVVLDKYLKEIFINLNISLAAIDSWFLSPDYIRYFKIEDIENIIATRIITYKGTKKILFYHMNLQKNFPYEKEYKVCTSLIFDYEMFEDMISSPIRFYLFVLDRFGIDMDLNGVIKKLFFDVKLPNKYSINVNSKSNRLYSCWQTYKNSKGENCLSFVYSIDVESYLHDFKKKLI